MFAHLLLLSSLSLLFLFLSSLLSLFSLSLSSHTTQKVVDGNVIRVLSRLRALGGRTKSIRMTKVRW